MLLHCRQASPESNVADLSSTYMLSPRNPIYERLPICVDAGN